MRRFSVQVLAAVAIAAAPIAAHAGEFDGTWTGHVGSWDITLVVRGNTGDLRMRCGGAQGLSENRFEVPVSATGRIDTYLRDVGFNTRQLQTELPTFTVESTPSIACRGGTTTLTHSGS